MTKMTKKMRIIHDKIDYTQQYTIQEAIKLLKELAMSKFIESVDVAVNLGIDARKSDQNVRGIITLPNGTGRYSRVAVFAQGDVAKIAQEAGADLVGTDNLVDQIKKNKFNFDIVIAHPDVMHIVIPLSQQLGPKGLMPNLKLGTITNNITEAIKKAKLGQIHYRNDKNGIIHTTIGKINFDYEKLKENLDTLLLSLKKAKPLQFKGIYIKKISLSTTMGVGMTIDQKSFYTGNN